MNHMHPNGSAESYETPVPGCLGKVVNLFDLTSGITRNKLITDKPHSDVSLLSRSRSDISRMTSPSGEEIKDRMNNSDSRSFSVKKFERTPVKKLIAQEMSNSLDSRNSSPNVVAKLMGLDALPQEQHFHHGKRCHSRNSYSEIPAGYWRQEDDFIHHQGQHKYKDIYEIWQPCSQTSSLRTKSPRNEEKMALVRQKFMEAKRLSTNEKLRQTKEFQDALEVLSSNQDLFLKVLQEPNSLISDHFIEQQQIPPLLGTKRITVLKPSKMVSGSQKQSRKSPTREQTWKDEECPQPTRIVVLKPSPGKALASSTPPINLRQEELIEKPGDDEAQEAMEVAKEITQKLRENLAGHRRDETLLSSVFSNGYNGDESSFNKSEAENLVGNLSDTEVMSPASRHSWEHASQFGSPYSCSSSSHAYYSPEPTVCQEAKKRLSERWAMVASNGTTGGEQRQAHRSSSTLGEMLSLSDVTKSEIYEVEDLKRDQESRASTSCLNSNTREQETESPRSLMRSKSLPAASGQRLTFEQDFHKTAGLKETLKQMTKSSFRGKITSLFFSRIMKSSKKMIGMSPAYDNPQLDSVENSTCPAPSGGLLDHSLKCSVSEIQSTSNSWQGLSSKKGALSDSNPAAAIKRGDNKDQLSSISALEPMFKDDSKIIKGSLSSSIGKHPSLGKSNLIDKSPPIGSIPRMLSHEEPCIVTATSKGGAAEEEEEWLFLIRSLLSAASIQNVMSLDPVLRDKFINENMTEPSDGHKWRHLRSIRHLVYDCVNAALVTGAAALENSVWARMKEWLKAGSGEGEEPMWDPFEEDGSCLVAERAARKEVMGKGWDDEVKVEVQNMVNEGSEYGQRLVAEGGQR